MANMKNRVVLDSKVRTKIILDYSQRYGSIGKVDKSTSDLAKEATAEYGIEVTQSMIRGILESLEIETERPLPTSKVALVERISDLEKESKSTAFQVSNIVQFLKKRGYSLQTTTSEEF